MNTVVAIVFSFFFNLAVFFRQLFSRKESKKQRRRNNLYKILAHQKTQKASDLGVSDASTQGVSLKRPGLEKAFD